MTTKLDRMGVLILVAHLVITLAFVGVYVVFAYLGKPVTTVENMLLVIVGYWFGAMGTTAIRPNSPGTQINQANEVKVNPPNDKEV